MNKVGVSTQCKVRECSDCWADAEFSCLTCIRDICLPCKQRHTFHDVVIYREKYRDISKEKKCKIHTDRGYENYCESCEYLVCPQCSEHVKHKILGIGTAYIQKSHQNRTFIQNIKRNIFLNCFYHLKSIKNDKNNCHKKILKLQSEMSTKTQRLKDLIDTVICDVKTRHQRYINRKRQQEIRNMNRHLAMIENYEHKFEQSTKRPVNFLLFVKKIRVPEKNDTPCFMHQALYPKSEEKDIKSINKLNIRDIQIIETGKRQLNNGRPLKLLSKPLLHKTVTVTGVKGVHHIACLASDVVWIYDYWNKRLTLTNSAGGILHQRTIAGNPTWTYGIHTVNLARELIYIDGNFSIIKQSIDNTKISILVKHNGIWRPQCVFCSLFNEDLLVGMHNKMTGKVKRYNNTGQCIQITERSNTDGKILYKIPTYITENHNGDVIVSDFHNGVVVTDRGGNYRFSYKGPPSGSGLWPRGICTDVHSNILVCDTNTRTLQMIDKDGQFLSLIDIHQQEINIPWCVGYDDMSHRLWVGSLNKDRIWVYGFRKRETIDKN